MKSMGAMCSLVAPWPIELIVVVDGSVDGSAEAAESITMPFPTVVIWQENKGSAAARNRGAAEARGKYILFLDDDMQVAPDLLVHHDRLLGAGADAVVGHIPVHPDSPRSLLTDGVERWAEHRHRRLVRSDGQLRLSDLITGQLSVRTDVFEASGGFDEDLNRGGTFGAEDTDFLYRLLQSGARVRYAPHAIAHQLYVVRPRRNLQQWRQAGRADAMLARKHPELVSQLVTSHGGRTLLGRALRALAPIVPETMVESAARLVVDRASSGARDWPTRWAFTRMRDAHYWRGVREGGGFRVAAEGPAILAFHAIEDVEDAVIGEYCVSPERFAAHVEALEKAGVAWIGAEELLSFLDGAPVPPQAVLLTFDDAYASLYSHAVPVLRDRRVPALVLPVTGRLGSTNTWDTARGATELRLLSTAQLRWMSEQNWAIGTHSRTHPHMVRLSSSALSDELAGALEDMKAADVPVVPVIAYPHGEHDVRVRAAARRAGYVIGLALDGGKVERRHSRFALPRIEVTRETSPDEIVALVRRPQSRSLRRYERELRWAVRTALAVVRLGPLGK